MHKEFKKTWQRRTSNRKANPNEAQQTFLPCYFSTCKRSYLAKTFYLAASVNKMVWQNSVHCAIYIVVWSCAVQQPTIYDKMRRCCRWIRILYRILLHIVCHNNNASKITKMWPTIRTTDRTNDGEQWRPTKYDALKYFRWYAYALHITS